MINDNEMIINKFFKEYFPNVEIKSNKTLSKSKVVKIGIQTTLKKIYKNLKIDEYMKQVMDGELFEGKDKILEFNQLWFENNVKYGHIYMSIDGTNINNIAEGVTLKEYGKAKENKEEPIISLSYLFNHTNNRPIGYDVYKGSIVDMAHIKGFLKKISNFGLEKVELILNKGYFSEKNIDEIMKHCCGFLMMVKENNSVIKEKIKEVSNSINSVSNNINDYDIYGITVKGKLFK